LLPVKARALVAPSQMVDTLLQVVFALADEKGLDVGDGFANAGGHFRRSSRRRAESRKWSQVCGVAGESRRAACAGS